MFKPPNVVHYDRQRRVFDGRRALDEGVGCDTLEGLIGLMRAYCAYFRIEEGVLAREVAETLSYRGLMLLVPTDCLSRERIEEKPAIRRHLNAMGVLFDEDLVSAVKVLCVNLRGGEKGGKAGVSDVRVRQPHLFSKMVKEQAGRCYYCGVSLVYGDNATLDHALPFFLGDDPFDGSNWRLCCHECNRGKGALPHYSLNMANVSGLAPGEEDRLKEAVRFGALIRDRACKRCGANTKNSELFVERSVITGRWLLDNVAVVCAKHRGVDGANGDAD